jgi:hypothetical protein
MDQVLVISLLLLAACGELRETTYDSVVEARDDGAFQRGWLPPELPSTTRLIREAHDLDTNVGWIAIRYDSAEYGTLDGVYQSPEWEFVPYDESRRRVRFPDPPMDWWPVELRPERGETPHTDVYTRVDEAKGHRWWVFVPPTQTDVFIWHGPEAVAGPLPR